MDPIILDKTGFPMMWVDNLDAYVHCLPVTKIQFEYFLCDAPSSDFTEEWYDTVLTLNPRVSPRSVNRSNYWRLFLTGIKPSEIETYAEWCGEEYELLNASDWKSLFQGFIQKPVKPDLYTGLTLGNRQATLLKKLSTAIQDLCHDQVTQADQLLYRYGVMEWVRCSNFGQEWGGLGQTVAGFQSSMRTADMDSPEVPRNPHGNRMHYYGFRLLKRA